MDNWFSYRVIFADASDQFFSHPRKFADRFTIKELPEWANSDATLEMYTSTLTREIKSANLCISAEYEADALHARDPNNPFPVNRSIHENIAEDLCLVPIAFWLTGFPLKVGSDIVHLQRDGGDTALRAVQREKEIYFHPGDAQGQMTEDVFSLAADIFRRLRKISFKGTVRTASWSIARALKEDQWVLRYLLYWLALESLFGAEDGREISFRISQRIALFVMGKDKRTEEYFRKVKNAYSWRSKIVHGLRLKSLDGEQSINLMGDLEEIVRDCYREILKGENTAKFDSKEREKFLDSLAFASVI